jgi:hypothetical protein
MAYDADHNPSQNRPRPYLLTGQNLETIERAGWDENDGTEVSSLPAPLPGPGMRQSLQLLLPDPVEPEAVLYVRLRGDQHGSATTIQSPPLPPLPEPAAVTPPH